MTTTKTAKSRKITDERAIIVFRGQEFEVSIQACKSARVQMDILRSADNLDRFYEALDAIFCNNTRDYMNRAPEEDGSVSPYGCSNETLGALATAAIEFAAKN